MWAPENWNFNNSLRTKFLNINASYRRLLCVIFPTFYGLWGTSWVDETVEHPSVRLSHHSHAAEAGLLLSAVPADRSTAARSRTTRRRRFGDANSARPTQRRRIGAGTFRRSVSNGQYCPDTVLSSISVIGRGTWRSPWRYLWASAEQNGDDLSAFPGYDRITCLYEPGFHIIWLRNCVI